MQQLDIALATIAATVIVIGVISNAIKRSILQEPMIAVGVGIAIGPVGLGWLDLTEWGNENAILEQAARLTLAIGLMGVAMRLRPKSIPRLWRPVTIMLTVGMLGAWLVAAGLIGSTLGLSFWMALLIGAVVTPTDPVVASSIVTGKLAAENLPLRLRDLISMESGANDGLAYILVMLPIILWGGLGGGLGGGLAGGPGSGHGWSTWVVEAVLVGVGLAALIGGAVGYGAARLLTFAEGHKLIEKTSLLGYSIAFSLLTLGGSHLVGADSMISVFLAGMVFNLCLRRYEEHEEERIQEAVAKLLTLPMFVLFGIALPVEGWVALGWPLLATVFLVILLRRPPVIIALLPVVRRKLNPFDVAFTGWFGPIGVAAVYYAAMARTHVDDPVIWHVASALIFASIIVHGMTAAHFTRRYARVTRRQTV